MSKVTRRKFLRDAGIGAGALVWGCYIGPKGLFAREHLPEIIHTGVPLGKNNYFVAIVPIEGTIVITTHRAEMGQGIRSSLAAVLADELEADWSRVRLRQANADSDKYAIEFPYEVKEELPFPYNMVHRSKPPQYLIPVEGSQFTDSSRSMTAYFKPMRLFGAGVRAAFEQAAARVFNVDPSQCHASQHKVHAGGQSIDYGDPRLLFHAGKLPPAKYEDIEAALKDPKDWVFITAAKKPMPFADVSDMVTGKPIYGADQDLPGMLTAMIERCPVANGRITSFDPAPALAVPGVRKVMRVLPANVPPGGVGQRFLPHDGIAVIAENTWAALQGRRALRPTIVCDYPDDLARENAKYDSQVFRQTLKDSTAAKGMLVRKTKADLSDADFADSANVVEAEYYVPHLAQAPMEPPVAIALYRNETMEAWAPTQNPELAQQDIGRVLYGLTWDHDLDEEEIQQIRKTVTLHMPLLGGGFGRKSKPDYILEAAFLAKQNPGVPIRVQWTREDDIKFSYYNAASSQYLKAAVDGKKTTALLQRSAFTSFFGTLFPESRAKERAALFNGGIYPYGSAIERAQGLEDMPFDVPKLLIENCPAKNYIRVGWMRSVANIYHAFASGSFADELAEKKGADPKDHLLDLIGNGRIIPLPEEAVPEFNNNGLPVKIINLPVAGGKILPMVPGYPPDTRHLLAVVKKVAEVSDWNNKVKQYKGTRRGLGIAAHRSFLSYVATVIDVSLSEANELTINDVYTVVDCGLAVNPDRVKAQMEGAVVYGLSLALLGEITVKNGAVEQNNFDDYPVLRIHQTPRNISVTIMEVDKETPPTGIGEVGVPTVAPALANAIVAAGGPRIREIPFYKKVVVL
ncbi:MAG: twin-arginine translocation pathway signal protein [Acidobacteria bacterium]|nr:MAG: twin-arginine translocation pathway signal protein [Acidobacteriota bacterium]